jgi:hypothetical protein
VVNYVKEGHECSSNYNKWIFIDKIDEIDNNQWLQINFYDIDFHRFRDPILIDEWISLLIDFHRLLELSIGKALFSLNSYPDTRYLYFCKSWFETMHSLREIVVL